MKLVEDARRYVRHKQLGSRKSGLEAIMLIQLKAHELQIGCQLEYLFHDGRRWRFDFAWHIEKLALEIEGGTWSGGRHTRGKGFENDCEKYNTAAIHGWTILRCTRDMVLDGRAINFVRMMKMKMEEKNGGN